jgi:transglutaminase-like putative cysteine protease
LLRRLPKTDPGVAQLHALSATILQCVRYAPGRTGSATSVEESLGAGAGVCQDHTHIYIAAARELGYPARYVCGYLLTAESDVMDASHAWAEVHTAGLGWIGLDVSNGISPDERYVRVATGLDASEASPISGIIFGGVSQALDVAVRVEAL